MFADLRIPVVTLGMIIIWFEFGGLPVKVTKMNTKPNEFGSLIRWVISFIEVSVKMGFFMV